MERDAEAGAYAGGESERLRRWRLVLGGAAEGELGPAGAPGGGDARVDAALGVLYDGAGDAEAERNGPGSLGASAPGVARWLGDVRELFPPGVVQVMQADALDRLGLRRMLLEPDLVEAVRADVHLAAALLSLREALPDRARESARAVVRRVAAELEERLARRTRAAVHGALDRSARADRPRRAADVDWPATIRRNLRHRLPEQGTVVPETLVGRARRAGGVRRDVVLAVDQSASMAASLVYAGVFGAVLASVRSLRTSFVAFDTSVADLTGLLSDPVEVLFGTSLGGGTDVNRALAYCAGLVRRPAETVLVLVSDLREGGSAEDMVRRAGALKASGVQVVVVLALSDEGAPRYDRANAAALAALGIPAFACSPDRFPDLMAAAIEGRPLQEWADRGQAARG